MKKYLVKFATATSIFLVGISANHSKANAATLYIGNYAYFAPEINLISFIPLSKLRSENANSQSQKLALMRKIDVLAPGKHLKRQIEQNYQDFTHGTINNKSQTNRSKKNKTLTGIANTESINQNIDTRYQGMVETNTEKIDLFTANKINKKLLGAEEQQKLSESLIDGTSTIEDNNKLFPISLTALVIVTISGLGFIVLFPVVSAFFGLDSEKGLNILGLSFGKIKIPDDAIALHNKTFQELSILAQKAEKINDEKFSNREFILFIKLKYQIAKGSSEYQNICQSIQYLEVAISASSSYLKIESTELRYRSRKQQAFYQFVIDNITENIDKLAFKKQVYQKLEEVITSVNSEEGKEALKAYLIEINKIAQHDLGLKLLSLFKKYQLADFAILKKVSDLVDQVNGQDLQEDKNLMAIILTNYEVLEKLAPIIQISEKNINPQMFAKLLQYMGLVRRYEKAFQEFQDLIQVLRQWEKPFNSLQIIREQYPNTKYQTPKEFGEKIPGLNLYHKYQEYINSHE